jgi:L-lactate dehydrogenase complex protein LldG
VSAAKEDILDRIRQATGGSSITGEVEYESISRNYRQAGVLDAAARVELFIDRLADYGSAVYRCSETEIAQTVAGILTEHSKTGLLVPRDLPRTWLPDGFYFFRESPDYAEVDSSEGVLTDCALAIASTGTIVLRHAPGEVTRALSLIPDYHLCIVFPNQIVETVPEGIRQMSSFASLPITTISGPSATSDIEMTRIKGVHGPRTLEVILIS